jgi:hypothetical protein
VGAEALAREWRGLVPVLLAVILVGIPGNVHALAERDEGPGRFVLGSPALARTLPTLPVGADLPDDFEVGSLQMPGVTIGWLRDAVRSGKLRPLRNASPGTVASATTALTFQQRSATTRRGECEELDRPRRMTFEPGDHLSLEQGVLLITPEGAFLGTIFEPSLGSELVVALPARVTLSSVYPQAPAVVCTGAVVR